MKLLPSTPDAMIGQVDVLQLGRYQPSDLVAIARSQPNTSGTTNLIHIHRIGDHPHAAKRCGATYLRFSAGQFSSLKKRFLSRAEVRGVLGR